MLDIKVAKAKAALEDLIEDFKAVDTSSCDEFHAFVDQTKPLLIAIKEIRQEAAKVAHKHMLVHMERDGVEIDGILKEILDAMTKQFGMDAFDNGPQPVDPDPDTFSEN